MTATLSAARPSTAKRDETSFAITLMAHMVVPTFVLDAAGKVLIWNRACERLTGVPAAEVLGTRDHWRAFYSQQRQCLADLVAGADWTSIGRLYTTHEDPSTPAHGVHAENWCHMPRRGQELYLAVDAGPVYDEAGHLVAVIETLRDITDKKLAETKVREQASILQVHYEEHQREAEMARRILEHQFRADLMGDAGVHYEVKPATNFSGDIILAARSPGGALYAILADATGHGLAAAVSVLPVVQEFYRLVEQNRPLEDLVESINFVLANSLPLGRFVAAAFVRLDEEARSGQVWVGGTPDVLMLDPAGQIVHRFTSAHLPLGVVAETGNPARIEAFTWTAPRRLLIHSDGVIEAADADGRAFGDTGIAAALSAGGDPLGALRTALAAHLQGQAAHDDMSLLLIDCPA